MQEFNDYLYRSFTAENKDFCLVTVGDLHLKRWLRLDAKNKGVKLAAHFSKFVDLRAEFKRQYPRCAILVSITLRGYAHSQSTAIRSVPLAS